MTVFMVVVNCGFGQDWLINPEIRSSEGAAEYGKYHRAWKNKDAPEVARQYLLQSARKGYPDACILVSDLIENEKVGFEEFGESKPLARLNLLRRGADRKHPGCLLRLGELFRDGPDEIQNLEEARRLIGKAAYSPWRLAWEGYSEMCEEGIGGEKSLGEAYFFISAVTETVHPESLTGKKAWKAKRRIAVLIGKDRAVEEFEKLKKWLSETGNYSLSLAGAISDEESRETYAMIRKYNLRHQTFLNGIESHADPAR